MLVTYVIIPCRNETSSIEKVINEAEKSIADNILVVENGSADNTLQIIKSIDSRKLNIVSFNIPLGYDVPRAIGLLYAKSLGGTHFVFIDGDMRGITSDDINSIIISLKKGTDLVLTDCYPIKKHLSDLASEVIYYRKKLNVILGIYKKIKFASPSHGPHGISKKLAENVPPEFICIPPLLLCYSAKNKYKIDIGLKKSHINLESVERSEKHNLKIAETIIGDCICAINSVKKGYESRILNGIHYDGFNSERRFDILKLIRLNDFKAI